MDREIGVGRTSPSMIRSSASLLRRWGAGGGKRSLHSHLRWAGFFFVLPALIHLVIFKFYPMLQALRLSFFRYDLMSPPVFTGLENYKLLWENPLFHQSFWVSVKYMFGVSIPEWFFALGLALLLNRRMPGRSVIRLAYFFPIAMSQIVVAMVWKFMYHPFGLVNTILETSESAASTGSRWRNPRCPPSSPSASGVASAVRRNLPGGPPGHPEGIPRSGHHRRRGRVPALLLRDDPPASSHDNVRDGAVSPLGRKGVPQSSGHDRRRPQRDDPGAPVLHLRNGFRLLPHGGGRRGFDVLFVFLFGLTLIQLRLLRRGGVE